MDSEFSVNRLSSFIHIQQNVNKLLKLETVIGIGTIVNGLSEYRSGYISSLLAWSQSQLGSKSQDDGSNSRKRGSV